MRRYELTVPCQFGEESITAHQIRSLGYETSEVADGKVTFEGDDEAIALANVNLRCGERVLIKVKEFDARSFDELFEGVRAIEWEEYLPKSAAFPVKGYSLKSQLHSVPDCQSIIKKAVVTRMSAKYGLNIFEETGEMHRIHFSILKDMVTIYIDTTGAPLYKRGYRVKGVEAPLRETLAFTMIDVSRWRGDRYFHDPFCGSGTIAIEAAMLALNIAPGIGREFVSESWASVGKKVFDDAREEAREGENKEREVKIFASDIDPDAVVLARANAKKAGVEGAIKFFVADVKKITPAREKGVIACNPPYGERLMDAKSVGRLYTAMGRKFAEFDECSKLILTSHEEFEKFYGTKADKKRKLYNGMLKCNLYTYFADKK
ncbi:MAG: class I SAM-dependent RNA methyltransferase [Clostridia bacterium]|nr:class I SAM-dependent RNA methyltransferase [Clostridia bacterium]